MSCHVKLLTFFCYFQKRSRSGHMRVCLYTDNENTRTRSIASSKFNGKKLLPSKCGFPRENRLSMRSSYKIDHGLSDFKSVQTRSVVYGVRCINV